MWAFGRSLESESVAKVLKSVAAVGVAATILGGATAAHAAVTASVNGSKLTVTGDGTSNQVTILQYDGFNTLYVIDEQTDANVIVTPSNGIDKIDVNLGGGDDFITYRPAQGDESVCVWDLEVIARERAAYVDTWLAGAAPAAAHAAWLAAL